MSDIKRTHRLTDYEFHKCCGTELYSRLICTKYEISVTKEAFSKFEQALELKLTLPWYIDKSNSHKKLYTVYLYSQTQESYLREAYNESHEI